MRHHQTRQTYLVHEALCAEGSQQQVGVSGKTAGGAEGRAKDGREFGVGSLADGWGKQGRGGCGGHRERLRGYVERSKNIVLIDTG